MTQCLRDEVRIRAGDRCEYCQMPQAFTTLPHELDHIRSQRHHGPTNLGNSAWSCALCNRAKGRDAGSYVPGTDDVVRLFHPRRDVWDDHFAWDGAVLHGETDIGSATIELLAINADSRVQHRALLIQAGLFPPNAAA